MIKKIFYNFILISLIFLGFSCQQTETLKIQTFTIEYDSNGHGINPETIEVVENTKISSQLLAPLEDSDGYYCKGWLLNDEPISEGYKITHNIKLKACWGKYLTVSYIDNNGNNKIWPLKNIKNGYVLTKQELPQLPDMNNLKFKGWYINSNLITEGFKVIEDITLTASWGETYTVIFKDDKSSYYNSERGLQPGSIVNVPKMNNTILGYNFDGWYNGAERISTSSITVNSDLTIVAKWNPSIYKIFYDLGADNITNTNVLTYTIEDEVTFNDLVRDGYIFKGWYSDNLYTQKVTEIKKGSTGSKYLYACWIEDGAVGDISSLDTKNTSNVCSSIISFNTEIPASRSITNTQKKEIQTLTYFENGIAKPFIFSTNRHKKILLSVTDIVQISDTVIAIKYDAIWKVITLLDKPLNSDKDITISFVKNTPDSQALVNLKTGEYFDFNDYQLKNMTSNKDYIIAFGKNGQEAKTLYKININNIKTAVPLNNADFDPLDSNNKIYSWGNDFVYYTVPGGNPKMYYLNEDKPFITINRCPVLDNPNIHMGYMHYTYLEDSLGNVFMYSFSESDFRYYITAKVDIDKSNNSFKFVNVVEKQLPEGIYQGGTHFTTQGNGIFLITNEELYETNELLEFGSGCYTKASIVNGNIELSFKKINSNFYIYTDTNYIIYKSNLYYLRYGKIYSYNLENNIESILYTNSNLISTSNNDEIKLLTLVDDDLIFYQTIGATGVGTYSIPIIGLNNSEQPKLLSEYKSDVKNLIYLKI